MKRSVRQHDWIQKARLLARSIKGLVGEPLVLNISNLEAYNGSGDKVDWWVGGEHFVGSKLSWTPRSPGFFQLRVRAGSKNISRIVVVGIKPSLLVEEPDKVDFYFCLIIRNRHKVHFIPIMGSSGKGSKRYSDEIQLEVKRNHPNFASLLAAQTRIYRNRILPRPFLHAHGIQSGLYAVCANDLLHLGTNSELDRVIERFGKQWLELTKSRTGRGVLLRSVEQTLSEVKVTSMKFSGAVSYPKNSARRRSKYSAELFTCSVVSSLVSAGMNFARGVGRDYGTPMAGLTSVITFNSGNGALSTSLFDSAAGLSRQVLSVFETGQGIEVFGSKLNGFGNDRGTSRNQFAGVGIDLFGGGRNAGAKGIGASLRGISPISHGGNQAAMDGEGGSGIPEGGSDQDGVYEVEGADGSTVGFDYGPDGDPVPNAVETLDDGTEIWYGEETTWEEDDFEPEVITGSSGDGGDDGTDGDGGTDGGTTEGGEEGGGEGEGEGEGDGGDATPPSTDPAEMPAPDDGTGGGGGSGAEGSGTVMGGFRGGPKTPLGVLTCGGGFTNPGLVNVQGGGSIVPGGGVSDPADYDSAGPGFFGSMGGYNPPMDGVTDPVFDGSAGAYEAGSTGMAETVSYHEGARIGSFNGTSQGGCPLDGVVSGCTFAEPGSKPRSSKKTQSNAAGDTT